MIYQPTPQQEAIIKHTSGPMLVIAGPGAGKTFTLVQRIAHLVIEENVPPEQILVATFTEKAAQELEDRIARELLAKILSSILMTCISAHSTPSASGCLRKTAISRGLRKIFP